MVLSLPTAFSSNPEDYTMIEKIACLYFSGSNFFHLSSSRHTRPYFSLPWPSALYFSPSFSLLFPRFIATLRGHVERVYQVSWSSDSRLLCSGSSDSTLKVKKNKEPVNDNGRRSHSLSHSSHYYIIIHRSPSLYFTGMGDEDLEDINGSAWSCR